ncbi:MAG: cell division protein FtsZ [Alphaproteobacteria bacterium]
MTLHLQMPSQVNNLSPRILVIGVGGAGGNIINSMKDSGVEGVEFLNVNTDSQQLKHSKVEKTLQLGPSCTMGLGAGADPEMGKKSAEEVAGEIEDYLDGAHMVFITAGMGGGTGTGATPVIARIAKELGILTVGVVTKPFEMEGKRKIKSSEEGIIELQKYVDNLIVIPNQNIFHLAKPQTSFTDSLQFADNVLIDGVKSIIDLMVNPGIMNHDFADVKAIMSETGKVHLGTGVAEGESRVMEATESAISNPLLENNSMKGARGVLINVTCSDDTSLHDIDQAINRVQEESDEEAQIIWGVQKDVNMNGKFKISVISTGIDCENYYKNFSEKNKVTSLNNFENIPKTTKEVETTFGLDDDKTPLQTSFFVDLQQSPNKKENYNDEISKNEKESSVEKRSLFSKIFGLKKSNLENLPQSREFNSRDQLNEEFKSEIKEMVEQNNSHIDDEDIQTEAEENFNNQTVNLENFDSSKNLQEKDEDVLQIPAFLRRQAN